MMHKKTLKNHKTLVAFVLMLSVNDCFASATDSYSPILELSATNHHSRRIGEMDLMLPFIESQNGLTLFDIKLKGDNHKSLESNLGLVYRHNFSDKAILGLYGFYDRRKTQGNLIANQLTLGIDLLSDYVDGRFNIYIPDNKKKTISSDKKNFVRLNEGADRGRVYIDKSGGTEECSLPGYDIEIGTPIFSLFPKLNEQLGTKIYLANYKFSKKGIATNSGMRLRLEQKIKDNLFNNRQSEITLHLGSSYTNRHKWNNFVGLNFRVALSQDKVKKSNMQKRMMDVVVRDVDVVTQTAPTKSQELPVFWQGKKIEYMYFVTEKDDENYEGDGSYKHPYSRKQLVKLIEKNEFQKKDTNLIIPIKAERNLSETEYQALINECFAEDIKKYNSLILQTDDQTLFPMESIPNYFPDFKKHQITESTLTSREYDLNMDQAVNKNQETDMEGALSRLRNADKEDNSNQYTKLLARDIKAITPIEQINEVKVEDDVQRVIIAELVHEDIPIVPLEQTNEVKVEDDVQRVIIAELVCENIPIVPLEQINEVKIAEINYPIIEISEQKITTNNINAQIYKNIASEQKKSFNRSSIKHSNTMPILSQQEKVKNNKNISSEPSVLSTRLSQPLNSISINNNQKGNNLPLSLMSKSIANALNPATNAKHQASTPKLTLKVNKENMPKLEIK